MRTFLLSALVLAGCATAPKTPFEPAAPAEGKAAVYFFRPSQMTGMAVKPTLSVDGVELGKLGNHGYGVAQLPPGFAHFRSLWPGIPGARGDDELTLDLQAGRTYYVRVRRQTTKDKAVTPSLSVLGGMTLENRPGLEDVSAEEALKQLAGMAPTAGFPVPPKP